uniref:NHS-like protein 2 n=1 Tax=Oncorhynchus tshawytscha TaxID=74940 RepID=A0A8C8FU48_ONCTS
MIYHPLSLCPSSPLRRSASLPLYLHLNLCIAPSLCLLFSRSLHLCLYFHLPPLSLYVLLLYRSPLSLTATVSPLLPPSPPASLHPPSPTPFSTLFIHLLSLLPSSLSTTLFSPSLSPANTNLDAESKRSAASSSTATSAHFRSPWQQSVNVFGSWSRPDCVQELHQEAQLNLQSLLQDFEEQLYDTKLTGQTFRHPTASSQSSDDTSTTLSRSPVSLNNKRPEFIFLVNINTFIWFNLYFNLPLLTCISFLYKLRLLHKCSTGGELMCPSQTSLGLSVSSGSQSHSSSFTSISEPSGHRHPGTIGMMMGRRSETEGAASSSTDERSGLERGMGGGERRERSARSVAAANAFKFRERSLSTPTDSGSFCSTDNICGGIYALFYPSGSSEDGSNSIDNVSVTDGNFPPGGRLRLRSRSISLKKSKRKPPPPVRSVSLVKNLGDAEGHFLLPSSSLSKADLEEPELGHGGVDGPPSLEVHGPDTTELSFPAHWQLEEWKASDPYRSLSGSSTATGTTVIECMKVRGSSESLLDSPSTSRATSPSLLSIETESTKASSPFKPPGLMSPSSGYSSQSETPTPITPSNQVAGTPTGPACTLGCKMRPKIPERKSSLPATSPRDPAARSRLSFEMPVNAHLDLSSIKPKQKASRRHSDTSTAIKPGKLSAGSQSTLPVVITNELRNIRLRSVSRTDLEDCLDGASNDIIEEEQGRDLSPLLSPRLHPRPPRCPQTQTPVAFKPPLPKRPLNILLKSPSSSPVASDSPCLPCRKPKLKKAFPHTPTSPFRPQEHPQTFPSTTPRASTMPPPSPTPGPCTICLLSPCPSPSWRTPPWSRSSTLTWSSVLGLRMEGHSPLPAVTRKCWRLRIRASLYLSVEESSSVVSDKTELHITEEMDDDVRGHTPTTHTTEDLFTKIHRSKRKVLGRKEPGDSFGSRQSLVSPVKHSTSGGDLRTLTLGSTPRSTSRNDNFMALLQKKGSKSSTGGARVSAMELLKSTNPLARRVTEFSTSADGGGDMTTGNNGTRMPQDQ